MRNKTYIFSESVFRQAHTHKKKSHTKNKTKNNNNNNNKNKDNVMHSNLHIVVLPNPPFGFI